jgi:heptosyltransferase II
MEEATVPQMRRMVILAPNWLGDAVMALPAIADVRRRAPQARLVVAARPAVAPLFTLVRDVDAVVVLGPRPHVSGWLDAGAELRSEPFDAALLLPNSFQSALAVSRAGIADRWGYRTDWRRALLTKSVAPPKLVHQIEYYQHLVRSLGFPSGPPEPSIDVAPDVRDNGRRVLIAAGWDGRTPIVALAPGAAYGGAKRWPPAYFAELVRALHDDGVVCAMVGSAADRRTGDEIAASCGAGHGLIDLIGATDLPELAGVLVQCRSLVSNDSGAMHLGAAVGVPVTAMFGPTNDRATRPLGGHHVVLTHAVWCRPCMLRECPLDHRCMLGISPNAVHAAARRTL